MAYRREENLPEELAQEQWPEAVAQHLRDCFNIQLMSYLGAGSVPGSRLKEYQPDRFWWWTK